MTMVNNESTKNIIVAALIILILGLWISDILPRQADKMAALSYVQKNCNNMELIFDKMEFSSVHGDYFAIFKDSNGKVYNFLMSGKLWPTTVWFDPINPLGKNQ